MKNDWLMRNQTNWDERVPIHRSSEFYDVKSFLCGKSTLSAQEIADLAPVEGKTLIHLQCHFGLDTLSWAREGAIVTGLDFSDPAITEARKLAAETGLDAEFITANVYDAADNTKEQFDIVYTGIGALCWLPDMETWAKVVARLLKSGGEFYLTEFHPTAWMFEDSFEVQYGYFSPKGGEEIEETSTYTDGKEEIGQAKTVQWNPELGKVVSCLINAGLTITSLTETKECVMPYLPGMERQENGRYALPNHIPSPPMMYTLRAKKPLL